MPPEQTRERLLTAAKSVFVEVGFYDATVREICKRAGVNIALINYHFKDKLGLYTEVLKGATMSSSLSMLERANDPDLDPVDILRSLIRVMIRKKSQVDHAFDILMQQESLRPTPAMAFLIEETMRPAYVAMCTLVGRILQTSPQDVRCRMATHSIIGQIKYFGEPGSLLSPLDPEVLSGKTPDEIADFISCFSLRYLQPDSQPPSMKSGADNRARTTTRNPSKVHSKPSS